VLGLGNRTREPGEASWARSRRDARLDTDPVRRTRGNPVRGTGPERADKQLARAAMRLANSHQSDGGGYGGGHPGRVLPSGRLRSGLAQAVTAKKKLRPS